MDNLLFIFFIYNRKYKKEKTMIGIYKITNKITGQSYIGQSSQIEKRKKRHFSTANNPMDHSYNNPLYRAIRKYGKNNFDFSIIEECSVQQLNEKERYWIKFYNTFFNGYNLTMGGDGSGTQQKKESIIGIIYDLENTNLFQKEIAKKWKISEEMVQGINTGRYWKHDRKYPIRESPKKIIKYCVDCGKQISKDATRCVNCENKRRQKEFTQNLIDRNKLKHLIRTTPFTTIGAMYNVSDNAVRKWCDKLNLPRKKSEIKKYSDEEWAGL